MAAPKGPPPRPTKADVDALLKRWEADKKSRLFLQLAEEYRKQDAIDAALSVLREGLKHHQAFAPAHVALARCLHAKGQLAQAQAELEPIVRKSPDNILAGKLLAQVLQERGERHRALEVLQRVAPFAPDDEEVADRLALLQAALGATGASGGSGETAEFSTSDVTASPLRAGPTSSAMPTPLPAAPAPVAPPATMAPAEPEPDDDDVLMVSDEEASAFEAPAPPPMPRPATPPDDLLGAPLAGPPGDSDEDELTSVTLAELYESQGGFAEASAIYERLLRRRPSDLTLQRAVERCRARLTGAGPDTVATVSTPAPPPPARPRWEPVRSRDQAPPPPPPRPGLGPARGPARLRAVRREMRRWLAAARSAREMTSRSARGEMTSRPGGW